MKSNSMKSVLASLILTLISVNPAVWENPVSQMLNLTYRY